MGVSPQVLGLRDRKKIQTRETIRREAMRLIEDNGYANTTVEQIAEAAEVSPSTFFRYFPSKEMVLMANDLDLVTIKALERQPADMSLLRAFRRALEITTMRPVCRNGCTGHWTSWRPVCRCGLPTASPEPAPSFDPNLISVRARQFAR